MGNWRKGVFRQNEHQVKEVSKIMVTCPECKAKISSEANPCPKCGLLEAGFRSEEVTRHRVETVVRVKRECAKCGQLWIVEASLITSCDNTYRVGYPFQCDECGYINR